MSLPVAWVDRIFTRMTLNYGVEFLNRYKGQNMTDIKTDWCDQLAGYEKSPDAISFALENLPEKPPTVMVFKNLCRQAPTVEPVALPMPKVNPEIAAKVLNGLKAAPSVKVDHEAWAKAILRDVQGGLKRNQTVVAMARAAIKEAA